MYSTFFGFRELPFSHTNDLRFFYPTPTTRNVEERIKAALHEHPGLILLTGDPGTGKTILLRRILSSLDDNVRIISLPFSAARFDDILGYLCEHFAIKPRGSDSFTKVLAIQEHLRTWSQQGLTTVLCIDEAQNLLKETLDRLRLLLHLRGPTGKLLQILLVGQPWLETKLAHPDLCHLQQYITTHCRLTPLAPETVKAFIQHRLKVAGYDRRDLFSPGSIQRITQYSQAIPQLINVLCDNSLLAAYMARSHTVTRAFVEEVAENLQLTSSALLPSGPPDRPLVGEVQLPVLLRAFPRGETLSNNRWMYNLSWASIGVLCAWLSSIPQSSWHSPLLALSPTTAAKLVPSLVGTPTFSAMPPWMSQPPPLSISSLGNNLSEEFYYQYPTALSSSPLIQTEPTGSSSPYPSSAALPPSSSTLSPVKRSHGASALRDTSTVPTLSPTTPSAAPQSQSKELRLAKNEREANSAPPIEFLAPSPGTQSSQFPTSERNEAHDAKALSVSQRETVTEAKNMARHFPVGASQEALFRITRAGNVRKLEWFLKTRGQVNVQDKRGWTALMVAAHDNQPDIVRLLLAHGAAINTENKEGETALIHAADNNHLEIVQILLEHGAAIDKKSKLGWTALMYAAAKGHRPTVAALLNKGANPKVRDNDGQTASSYAMRQGTVPSLGEQRWSSSSFRTRFSRIDVEKRDWLKRHEYREIALLLKEAEKK